MGLKFLFHRIFSRLWKKKLIGFPHSYPSTSNLLNIQEFDGSYLDNTDLSKTSYHVYKRSVNAPFIKKAPPSSLKKVKVKNLESSSSEQPKAFASDLKSEEDNNTLPLNTTELEASTVQTNISSEKYNVSVTKLPVELTNITTTTESTTPFSSTTVSTTSIKTTTFSDILPTRPANITNTTVDYHIYYNSTLVSNNVKALSYWVDFDKLPQDKVVVHRLLSDSHRKAATVSLSFDFPFYGHPLRNITIATGGFVYMGDYMHSWLAATQYIAPLMANFDTSLSSESVVQFFDNGTAFVIEWHNVTLQDEKKGGNFTFQTTLLNNGDIVFVYKEIPLSVTEIGDEAHPVKVGLSDAYVIDRMIYFIRRKTIYEYHRIDMKSADIGNNTAIYFNALETCMSFRDCKSCMEANVSSNGCVWCESAKRCSDGLDRLRQDWLQSKCDVEKHSVNCSLLPSPDDPFVQPLTDSPYKPYTLIPQIPKSDHPFETSTITHVPYKPGQNDDGASTSARVAEESSSMGVGTVVAVLLILAIVMGGLVWVGYAYKNPHTSSGQLLIRYRPSQWRFRSGEARYTAASVHM
ncbi:plexin domain-containing protein 1 [Trichonephila clavata]|uniref:Plexin domain-containing protein 1 n=1 Tax=Trichonephila clavata TaxID=2740835 RepID=A0A8X6I268_TRICU|nr:plexin domain-containing protein 1 [Trichonephila clavata]